MRAVIVGAALLAMTATAAAASSDQPVATAPVGAPPPPMEVAGAVPPEVIYPGVYAPPSGVMDGSRADEGQYGDDIGLDEDPLADGRPHGEVSVAVGTGGYRSVSGTAVQRIGKSGVVAVTIDQTDYGHGRRRRR